MQGDAYFFDTCIKLLKINDYKSRRKYTYYHIVPNFLYIPFSLPPKPTRGPHVENKSRKRRLFSVWGWGYAKRVRQNFFVLNCDSQSNHRKSTSRCWTLAPEAPRRQMHQSDVQCVQSQQGATGYGTYWILPVHPKERWSVSRNGRL